MKPKLSFEEFAYQCEWNEVVRLSQFIGEWDLQRMILKKIREFKRGRECFKGHGEKSEWAEMVRNWHRQYLEESAWQTSQERGCQCMTFVPTHGRLAPTPSTWTGKNSASKTTTIWQRL